MRLDLNLKNKSNHASGIAAEKMAAEYLRTQGFSIEQMRYKTKHGEIDIVSQKQSLLIFVEVKKRKNFGEDDPISATQKQRVTNAALQYLSDNPEKSELDMRFDTILIDSAGTLNHIIDSWRIE